MEVNSIRAYKLSAIVSRMLNKKEAFIVEIFLVVLCDIQKDK